MAVDPVPVSVEISCLIRWFWIIMLQNIKTRTRPSRLPSGFPSVRLAARLRAIRGDGPEDCGVELDGVLFTCLSQSPLSDNSGAESVSNNVVHYYNALSIVPRKVLPG